MSLTTLVIILLVFSLVGSVPQWPHSNSWGWGPSGIVSVLLVIVLLIATGILPKLH